MKNKKRIIQQKNAQKIKSLVPSGRVKLLLLTLLGLVTFLGTTQIVFSSQVAVTGERIKALEKEKTDFILNNNRMRNEINQISSLSHIDKRAHKDLGMIDGVLRVEYLSQTEPLANLR